VFFRLATVALREYGASPPGRYARELETMNIEKKSQPEFDPEQHVLAMYLLYATRPGNAEPDETGAYFIGEVGEAQLSDQRLQRGTPYSICEGIRRE